MFRIYCIFQLKLWNQRFILHTEMLQVILLLFMDIGVDSL